MIFVDHQDTPFSLIPPYTTIDYISSENRVDPYEEIRGWLPSHEIGWLPSVKFCIGELPDKVYKVIAQECDTKSNVAQV